VGHRRVGVGTLHTGDLRPRIPDEQRHQQPDRSGFHEGDGDDGQVAEVEERLRRAGSRSALGLLLAASDTAGCGWR